MFRNNNNNNNNNNNILRGFKTPGDAFRLPYSIAFDCSIRPSLAVPHPSLYLSHLSGRPRFFLPSGFQLTIIFANPARPILST